METSKMNYNFGSTSMTKPKPPLESSKKEYSMGLNAPNPQLLQLQAQIIAYRILARNQPLPPQIVIAVSGGPQVPQRPASSTSIETP